MSGWKVHFWEGCQKSVICQSIRLWTGGIKVVISTFETLPYAARMSPSELQQTEDISHGWKSERPLDPRRAELRCYHRPADPSPPLRRRHIHPETEQVLRAGHAGPSRAVIRGTIHVSIVWQCAGALT